MKYVNARGGTLYQGCALELMADLPDASIDLIVTDPPYRVVSGGKKAAEGFGWRSSVLSANDGRIFTHNDLKPRDYMSEFFRVLKPRSHCYVMINRLNMEALLAAGREAGFGLHNILLWRKNTANANRWYMIECEWVVLFYKPPAKTIANCGSKQIYEARNPTGKDKRHPTEKPVEVMRHYIENSSKPGDIVLDPFAGSGSTAVAAQESGRRWITCELDEKFAEVARERLERGSPAII